MTAKKTTPKKTGRPTKYSAALAEKICDLIREGRSLRKIAKMPGMPAVDTMRKWKDMYPDFLALSARARAESAALYAEKAVEVAQEASDYADLIASGKATRLGVPICDLPRGYVDAKKLLYQALIREAALRDDSRFGDRKTVKVQSDTPDLSTIDMEKLKAARELLYDETPDTDRT